MELRQDFTGNIYIAINHNLKYYKETGKSDRTDLARRLCEEETGPADKHVKKTLDARWKLGSHLMLMWCFRQDIYDQFNRPSTSEC